MVFGKRKSPPVAAFSVPVPRDTIVDPNDADLELIATIVDFVNYLFTDGFYRPEELPPHLVQLYHADFYVAQINNGGHSQFVHNCGTRWQMIFANAEAGLAAMGATAQANLMRGLTVWTAANPDKASAQTGFKGGRDSALDILDEAFNRQQEVSPVAPRAATWIRSWSGLKLVEPTELRKAWMRVHGQTPAACIDFQKRVLALSSRSCPTMYTSPSGWRSTRRTKLCSRAETGRRSRSTGAIWRPGSFKQASDCGALFATARGFASTLSNLVARE